MQQSSFVSPLYRTKICLPRRGRHLAIEDGEAAGPLRVERVEGGPQLRAQHAAQGARDGREPHRIQPQPAQQVQQLGGVAPVVHLQAV